MVIGIGDFKTTDRTTISPAAFLLKTGDYIVAVDWEEVTDKKQFISMVENSGALGHGIFIESMIDHDA